MIKNYCKIAWRNIRKNSAFSTINILGLSLGMASSLLILLWVREEQRVDNFHVNKEYLYSVYQQQYANNQVLAQYATARNLASELKRVIPEVQYATADFWNDPMTCKSGDKIIPMHFPMINTARYTKASRSSVYCRNVLLFLPSSSPVWGCWDWRCSTWSSE